jgi:ribonuclease HI
VWHGPGAPDRQGELWTAAPKSGARSPLGGPRAGIERFDYFLGEPDTTNNRMALRSAIAALDLIESWGHAGVRFVSDSNYVVLGMTEWVPAWRARGWRRRGGPIENLDLWRELVERVDRRGDPGTPVEWRWVRGHAGHAKNEYANALATRAAATQRTSDGLVPSGFATWLQAERTRGRYGRYDPDEELR